MSFPPSQDEEEKECQCWACLDASLLSANSNSATNSANSANRNAAAVGLFRWTTFPSGPGGKRTIPFWSQLPLSANESCVLVSSSQAPQEDSCSSQEDTSSAVLRMALLRLKRANEEKESEKEGFPEERGPCRPKAVSGSEGLRKSWSVNYSNFPDCSDEEVICSRDRSLSSPTRKMRSMVVGTWKTRSMVVGT